MQEFGRWCAALAGLEGTHGEVVHDSYGEFGHSASLGFEPRQRDPESLVLPLHHEAMRGQN